jgi:hypothetical protein
LAFFRRWCRRLVGRGRQVETELKISLQVLHCLAAAEEGMAGGEERRGERKEGGATKGNDYPIVDVSHE